jgi:hypothetical protein
VGEKRDFLALMVPCFTALYVITNSLILRKWRKMVYLFLETLEDKGKRAGFALWQTLKIGQT